MSRTAREIQRPVRPTPLVIYVSEEERARFTAAATRQDMPVSMWGRRALERQAAAESIAKA